MLNKIKTSLVFIVLFNYCILNSGAAFAQTFDDVNENDWYFSYVETLVKDGIVESAVSFYPNTPLTRAELVTMIIKSIDGLADFETPEFYSGMKIPY